MKPILKKGVLTVELHVPEEKILTKAREIGESFVALNQPTGQPLIDAVEAILHPPEIATTEKVCVVSDDELAT